MSRETPPGDSGDEERDERPTDSDHPTTETMATDSDTDDGSTEPPADTREAAGANRPASSDDDRENGVRTKLYWLALGVLTLVALFMLGVFYANASRFIGLWVADEFVPLVQAAFALVLLALSLAGIVRLTRELTGD
ncbi:hypothetical protein [Haloarchaeobius amylolyticus]|uniref:hypothetical protein n=1 Tax=Haloarchaeobius amylolyticus TaxID=1198296 RepID=UPI0022708EC5|nr:hypothetical protein [Haloarchaeobius amylolyticus]